MFIQFYDLNTPGHEWMWSRWYHNFAFQNVYHTWFANVGIANDTDIDSFLIFFIHEFFSIFEQNGHNFFLSIIKFIFFLIYLHFFIIVFIFWFFSVDFVTSEKDAYLFEIFVIFLPVLSNFFGYQIMFVYYIYNFFTLFFDILFNFTYSCTFWISSIHDLKEHIAHFNHFFGFSPLLFLRNICSFQSRFWIHQPLSFFNLFSCKSTSFGVFILFFFLYITSNFLFHSILVSFSGFFISSY